MREDVGNSVPVGSFHFAGPLFSLSCCSLTVISFLCSLDFVQGWNGGNSTR